MLNRYRKYSIAYIEGILSEVSHKVDLSLNAGRLDYLLDTSYSNDYLHSPMAGTAMMDGLLAMLEEITAADEPLVMIPLPLSGPQLEVETARLQFRRFLYGKGTDVLAARLSDMAYFMDEFHYDPFLGFPLLFAHTSELRALLMSVEDEVFSLLNTNTLLVPTGMDWLLLFDFNMDMLHLMAHSKVRQRARNHLYFTTQKKE